MTTIQRCLLRRWAVFLVIVLIFSDLKAAALLNWGDLILIRALYNDSSEIAPSAEPVLVQVKEPPYAVSAVRNLARLQLARGQADQAIITLQQVAPQRDDWLATYWLAQAYWQVGDKTTARRVWRTMPGFEAQLQYLLRNAMSYWGRNDIPGAEDVLRDVLDLDPEYGPAYLALGHLLIWDDARRTNAILAFEQAVKYLPQQSVDGHFASGLLYYARGDSVRAVPYLRFVVDREPTLTYWYFLWDALRISGDQAGAETAKEEMERLRRQIGR